MASLAPTLRFRAFTAGSATTPVRPLALGWVYSYEAGTTTPKDTYTNEGGLTANPNPTQLDARGEADIWLGSGSYKFVIRDVDLVQQGAEIDNVKSIEQLNNELNDALRADLADDADETLGAGLIGYKSAATGATGTTLWEMLEASPLSTKFATLAIAAASGLDHLVIPPGTYAAPADISFPMPVTQLAGAVIVPATAVNINYEKGLTAGVYQIADISAAGSSVTFDKGTQPCGYAEWLGAVSTSNTPSVEIQTKNAAALNMILSEACGLGKVELMPGGDYYVNVAVEHRSPNCHLMGGGANYDATYGLLATRLVGCDGSMTVLAVGSSAAGAAPPSEYAQGIKVTGLQVARNTAPVIASGCKAILVQYALDATFDDVRGDESMYSWYFDGCVSTRLWNCAAKRTSAGTGGGTDFWRGYFCDGTSGLFAGGNASTYFTASKANYTGAVIADSVGFYLADKFTDTFMHMCETTSCAIGVQIEGAGAAVVDATGNCDIQITAQTNDAFTVTGIYVHNLSQGGVVDISGGYDAPAAVGPTAARYVLDCSGTVNMTAGQMIMAAGPVTAPGILISNSRGVTVMHTIVSEATAPGVRLDASNGCYIAPKVMNVTNVCSAAVELTNSVNSACTIAPVVPYQGIANKVTYGIKCLSAGLDARNEFNCTGIDSAAITGGSSDKLYWNGASRTGVNTAYGTNITSGIMA